MKREPSIHVTESKLIELLEEAMEWCQDENPNAPDYITLIVNRILSSGKKHQLSNRKLLATNEKQRKRVDNIKKSSLEYAMIMAKSIYMVRRQLKHKGIDIAKPGTRDFTVIKDITASAMDWLELYPSKTVDQSFNSYVEAYMRMQGPKAKFNLIALRGKAEQIMEYQKSCDQLKSDPLPQLTQRAYKKYCECIIKQTGEILTHYEKIPEKFKYFMELAQESVHLKITPETWIVAQFEGLEWTKSIPEPSQLVGEKAMQRLQNYLYKNKIQLRETPDEETKTQNVNRLKNLRKIK